MATRTNTAMAALALLAAGCDRAQRIPASDPPAAPGETTVHVAHPAALSRLVAGFHRRDNDEWRWTKREFSIILDRPRGAAEHGAILVLRFDLPEPSLAILKSVNLSAAAGGVALPAQSYDHPGQWTYRQQVPAEAFQYDTLRVDFALDKAIPPGADSRELGILVTTVGLEAART